MPKTEIKRNPETYTDAPITGTIDQLLEQGHLLRFNDLKVWHGRASFGEDWEIESFSQYRPSRNIYENALYGTLHRQDAQDFADKRARRHSEAEPSLHSIVALSDESLILEGGEVNEIILPPDVVGSPKKFARTQAWYTPDLNPAMAALLDDRNAFIELGEVQKVASDFGLDAEKLREYAAVVNAYFSLTEFPLGKNISLMLNNAEFFEVKVKGEKATC